MSSTHGKVVEREPEYGYDAGSYRHLRMSDGTYAAIPAGMVCEVGDVVAVITAHELKLIESYRENVKR